MVADNLPDEQIDGIKQMFYMMDTDNTGDLSFDELKAGLHNIGHVLPDPDVRMLMDAVSFCVFFFFGWESFFLFFFFLYI